MYVSTLSFSGKSGKKRRRIGLCLKDTTGIRSSTRYAVLQFFLFVVLSFHLKQRKLMRLAVIFVKLTGLTF